VMYDAGSYTRCYGVVVGTTSAFVTFAIAQLMCSPASRCDDVDKLPDDGRPPEL